MNSETTYICIKETSFIHIENVPQMIAILFDEHLNPFFLLPNMLRICRGSFPMPFHLLQSKPVLKPCQPSFTKSQLLISGMQAKSVNCFHFWCKTSPVSKTWE